MSSVNNNIPFVPENTIDPAAGLNESIVTIDALLQLAVVSVGSNTPPGSPANGARYIVGTSPTGAWAGRSNQVAQWLDGAWRFYQARYALNLADGLWYARQTSTWSALAGGAPAWGSITGTLADQTDLQSALDGKVGTADSRLTDAREWTATTVSQAEAETGTATTRRAWTAQRVRQAIVAWWNGISSAWGRSFVASVDADAGRTALGLGNAATATLQSSSTDSTAGHVLTVGAAGILAGAENISASGWNSLGGMSRMVRAVLNVTTDGPFSGPFWLAGWYQSLDAADTHGIFYGAIITNQTPRFFTRSRTSRTWGAWVEVFHTGNLTPNLLASFTLGTLPSAAANARLQVYCSNLAGQPAPVYSDGTNWRRVSDNTIAN